MVGERQGPLGSYADSLREATLTQHFQAGGALSLLVTLPFAQAAGAQVSATAGVCRVQAYRPLVREARFPSQ